MRSDNGFTLIEVLVAMGISAVVMSAIYSTYSSQQTSNTRQEQVVAMQQNIRASMYLMAREIRMAGYNPLGTPGVGLQTATTDSIRFTMDIDDAAGTGNPNGNTGDSNEDITYSLYTTDGIQKLGRSVGAGNNQSVAENIEDLTFVYLDQSGATTFTIADIRSVEITLEARPAMDSLDISNKTLTTEIKCRNLGL